MKDRLSFLLVLVWTDDTSKRVSLDEFQARIKFLSGLPTMPLLWWLAAWLQHDNGIWLFNYESRIYPVF